MLDNPQETKRRLVEWIKDYFRQNGPECTAVIGISGGKDSSICAALCLEALGPERVLGVLMPNGEQPDIEDSRSLVKALGLKAIEINIHQLSQRIDKHLSRTSRMRIISYAPHHECISRE